VGKFQARTASELTDEGAFCFPLQTIGVLSNA
jgi:hypothetical protein